jgi:hypothetical protein
MDAFCLHRSHRERIPAWDCLCGFYAYKTEAAMAASEFAMVGDGDTVCGRVALWGRVIDHQSGYRAERAYPQVLYLTGKRKLDEVIRQLANIYAIECLPANLKNAEGDSA